MVLLDNNISYKLKFHFREKGIKCEHVSNFDLHKDTDDIEIWNFAKNNQFTILSKDDDFIGLQNHFGFPPKLITLKCGNKSTGQLIDIFENAWDEIYKFLENPNYGVFEVF